MTEAAKMAQTMNPVVTFHGVKLTLTQGEYYPAGPPFELVLEHSEGRLEVVLSEENLDDLAMLFAWAAAARGRRRKTVGSPDAGDGGKGGEPPSK